MTKWIIALFFSLFSSAFAICIETDSLMKSGYGDSCSSDLECKSLCCGSGTCDTHDPERGDSCDKPAGQSCLRDEFCQSYSVPICRVYKVGADPHTNKPWCKIYCFPEKKSGKCIEGICHAPSQPEPVYLDPQVNCENALDLPDTYLY